MFDCRKVYVIWTWMVVSTYPSEKDEFVSWDDYSPNAWKNKIHVPNHQPVMLLQNQLVIAAGFEVLAQLMATQMGIPWLIDPPVIWDSENYSLIDESYLWKTAMFNSYVKWPEGSPMIG